MPFKKRNKFNPSNGSSSVHPWITHYNTLLGAEVNNVSAADKTAIQAFYEAEILAGNLPASPSISTGDWLQLMVFAGTTLNAKMTPIISHNDMMPTNVGFVLGDFDAQGRLTGDGTSSIDSGQILFPASFGCVYDIHANGGTSQWIIGTQSLGSSGVNDRQIIYHASNNRLRWDGMFDTDIFDNAAPPTLGTYSVIDESGLNRAYVNGVLEDDSTSTTRLTGTSDQPVRYLAWLRGDGLVLLHYTGTLNYIGLLKNPPNDIAAMQTNLNTLMTHFGR